MAYTPIPPGSGGGGGGSVSSITSPDGSITVTNPGGPAVGVSVTNPSGDASWATTKIRVFAVDTVNGNDANVGFADSATLTAPDYAIACAAAGAQAKKTMSGLGAIFPRVGAGRIAEIVIANGGVNTVGTYTEDLNNAVGGFAGYTSVNIRGTGTNTTAGCVAFDGSTADCTYVGAITAPGMNVAGYNPTGAPTTTVIQCLKVGGAAPGFAAEAVGTMPFGARLRFDANTATVALRNVIRQVSKVTGTDTLTLQTSGLGAVPTAADVFYLEQPGPSLSAINLVGFYGNNFRVVMGGLGTPGPITLTSGSWTTSFLWTATNFAVSSAFFVTASISQSHPIRGAVGMGPTRVAGAYSASNCGSVQNSSLHVVGSYSPFSLQNHSSPGGGLIVGGQAFFQNIIQAGSTIVGGTAAIVAGPPRFFNQVNFQNVVADLSQIDITNPGGNGMIIAGTFTQIDMSKAGANTAITGSAGAGFAINMASAAPTTRCCKIIFDPTNLPTITGSLAQIGIAAGQTLTFANAAKGFSDALGNYFQPMNTMNGAAYKFSGVIIGGAGAVFTYVADTLGLEVANNVNPIGYTVLGCMPTVLYVKPRANTKTQATTVAVYKNGVASALTLSIPAGSTTGVQVTSVGVIFNVGDQLDLRADSVADAGTQMTFTAVVGYAS